MIYSDNEKYTVWLDSVLDGAPRKELTQAPCFSSLVHVEAHFGWTSGTRRTRSATNRRERSTAKGKPGWARQGSTVRSWWLRRFCSLVHSATSTHALGSSYVRSRNNHLGPCV